MRIITLKTSVTRKEVRLLTSLFIVFLGVLFFSSTPTAYAVNTVNWEWDGTTLSIPNCSNDFPILLSFDKFHEYGTTTSSITGANTLDCGGVEPVSWSSILQGFNAGFTYPVTQTYRYYDENNQAGNLLGTLEITFISPSTIETDFNPTFDFDTSFLGTQQTRFLDATVTGTTKASQIFDITYFLETSEFTAQNRPDVMWISVTEDNFITNQQTVSQQYLIAPLSQGTTTNSFNFVQGLENNTGYTYTILFWSLNSNAPTFTGTAINGTFDIGAGAGALTNHVVQNVYDVTTYEDDFDCSITNITGCISASFAFLFVPSQDSIDDFVSLNDSLANKFPFAYVYDFASTIDTLYSNPSMNLPTFSIPFAGSSITLLSYDLLTNVPFVPFIRSTMGYLLWFAFMLTMYRRTLTIFNTQTS